MRHDPDMPELRWYHVVIGAPLFALATFAILWGFALLGFVLEGHPA